MMKWLLKHNRLFLMSLIITLSLISCQSTQPLSFEASDIQRIDFFTLPQHVNSHIRLTHWLANWDVEDFIQLEGLYHYRFDEDEVKNEVFELLNSREFTSHEGIIDFDAVCILHLKDGTEKHLPFVHSGKFFFDDKVYNGSDIFDFLVNTANEKGLDSLLNEDLNKNAWIHDFLLKRHQQSLKADSLKNLPLRSD